MDIEKILFSIIGGIFQGVSTSVILNILIGKVSKKKLLLLILFLSIYGTVSLLFISNQLRFVSFLTILALLIFFVCLY